MILPEKIILWDWKGTLLNDTVICLDAMNGMLVRRGMTPLSLSLYKEVFGFPVIDYYRKVGFDFTKESFEQLSVEFIDTYNEALVSASLTHGTVKVLDYFQQMGKHNVIVSAMQQDMLLKSVADNGLTKYFADILGISNIYTASKSKIAADYLQNGGFSPEIVVLIGDTTHDFEVAQHLACRCILIADGHQMANRLKSTGAEVINTLFDLLPSDPMA
jgi:phosphoglycolate phosphatase